MTTYKQVCGPNNNLSLNKEQYNMSNSKHTCSLSISHHITIFIRSSGKSLDL